MLYQFSYVERSQQNSVVECKDQHLLNVAQSFIFSIKSPYQISSECLLTIAYLINRTPFSVLQCKTPYEGLHGSSTDYSIRVFRCYLHPHLLHRETNFSQEPGCVSV